MPMLRSSEIGTLIELTQPAVAISRPPLRGRTGRRPPATGRHRRWPTERHDAGDLVARCAAKSGRLHRRRRPPPTTSRCWARRRAPPASPKITMHFHRDILAIADTFARHILQPTADDVVRRLPTAGLHLRARRPGGLPAAVRRLVAADRDGHPGGAGPGACRGGGHHPVHRPHGLPGHPQGRPRRAARAASASAVSAGEHLPKETWEAVHERHRPAAGRTASAPPNCCTSSSRRPGTTSGPGPQARPSPATGPPSSTRTATRLGPDAVGRLAVIGPTGCRYLDDPRQANYVVQRLECHRRHLQPWTRTATSRTRPARTT